MKLPIFRNTHSASCLAFDMRRSKTLRVRPRGLKRAGPRAARLRCDTTQQQAHFQNTACARIARADILNRAHSRHQDCRKEILA